MNPGSVHRPLEDAAVTAAPYLAGGLVISLAGLLVPASFDLLTVFLIHLSALVALAVAIATRLAPLLEGGWFAGRSWSVRRRSTFGAVALVVVPTGVVGLVTLASSAALRYDASLQFLQLLSALDIAWVVSAVVVGGHRLWGRSRALVYGGAVGALCVGSIWNYLRVVGFTGTGGWLVDGRQLTRLVMPPDVVAAGVAIAILLVAVRSAD